MSKPPGVMSALGYRGFSISTVGERELDAEIYVHAGIVDLGRYDINLLANSPKLEDWLLKTGEPYVEPAVSGGSCPGPS